MRAKQAMESAKRTGQEGHLPVTTTTDFAAEFAPTPFCEAAILEFVVPVCCCFGRKLRGRS